MRAPQWLRRPLPVDTPAINSAARTNVGLRRSINEDRIFSSQTPPLWAVVDGMGGHDGGDIAAQMVVDRLAALSRTDDAPGVEALVASLKLAHEEIVARNRIFGTNSGATVVAAVFVGDEVMRIAWAGDSRAYHVRGSVARLLTKDHSVVQELVDAGVIEAGEAEGHPRSNIVTRAMGVDQPFALDQVDARLQPGDRIVLCSDGLSRSLDLADLDAGQSTDDLADHLMAGALRRDGSDNISVIVISA